MMLRQSHSTDDEPMSRTQKQSTTRDVYSILDQRELITTLKKKDPQAFEHLIQRYGSMLHKVASRIVGEDEARDVLQDTWLTVYRNIDSFGGQAALATWLYRIVVNMSLTHLRHRSRSDTMRRSHHPRWCSRRRRLHPGRALHLRSSKPPDTRACRTCRAPCTS